MKMVECMAEAILIKARLDGRPMDERLSIDYSLAALKAMRDPSDFMRETGRAYEGDYTAMIDAAIKEAEGE